MFLSIRSIEKWSKRSMHPKSYRIDPGKDRKVVRQDCERLPTPALDQIFSTVANDPNYEIIHGDTDSIMFMMSLAVFDTTPVTTETISEIGASKIDQATDDSMNILHMLEGKPVQTPIQTLKLDSIISEYRYMYRVLNSSSVSLTCHSYEMTE